MREHEGNKPLELESLIGLSTLECARTIVAHNTSIAHLQLRLYDYVPNVIIPNEPTLRLARKDFLNPAIIEDLNKNLQPNWNISLDSLLWNTEGERMHFPMLDLAVRKEWNPFEFILERFAEQITPRYGRGVLLETRKSFHYLGINPMPEDQFHKFLAYAGLTVYSRRLHKCLPHTHIDIVDHKHIDYSHIRGTTGLRLTTHGTKTFEPIVVAVL